AGAAQLIDKALGNSNDASKKLDAGQEARATMLRAKLLLARHDSKLAEAAFESAVGLDPNGAEIHAAYGAYRLQRHDWEKAHKQLEAAIALDPGNAAWLGDLAAADLG